MLTQFQIAALEVLPDRFWNKVDVGDENECWPWTAGLMGDFGHGCYWQDGRNITASRAAWIAAHGVKLRSEQFVCHSCDNPPCVNPRHLFLGDAVINFADMVAKNRQHRPTGDRHHNRKLSWSLVQEIRRRHEAGEQQKMLATEFGVHLNTIYSAIHGLRWSKQC